MNCLINAGLVFGLCLVLAGCAQNPRKTSLELSTADPKYSSEECVYIRNRILEYNDRVGSRFAIGVASGLLLGPFGLPIAVAADVNQNNERAHLNAELERRCVTGAT